MKTILFFKEKKYTENLQFFFEKISIFFSCVVIQKEFKDLLSLNIKDNFLFSDSHDDYRNADLVISLGGDGTFLESAHKAVLLDIPICGINLGRLGFLSTITSNNIDTALESIVNGTCSVENRNLLELASESSINFGDNLAINDVYILRSKLDSLISVDAYLNDELLNTYWSDGLIISTPTGCTAYSLSCNGPLILPGSNNFVLTPISPHNLTVRPLVYSDDLKLKLKVNSRNPYFELSVDGKSYEVNCNETIELVKSKRKVKLIKIDNTSYFNTLREKLNWGLDSRN